MALQQIAQINALLTEADGVNMRKSFGLWEDYNPLFYIPADLYLLATRIATRTGCPKSSAVSGLYGRLSIGLVRANARALLARSSSLS
ncbi:hypothetical protein EMCRGX_G002945 [Ephydatia muelleri]